MTTPRQLTHLAADLVDPHVGVLHAVDEVRTELGSPSFFHFAAVLCDTRHLPFSEVATCGRTGAAAADRDSAVARTLLDAVTFYCAAFRHDVPDPPWPASSAPFNCVPPSRFVLFAEEAYRQTDFPWSRFDDDTCVHWRPALDPLRDETLYVPSSMVHLPYAPLKSHQESAITPVTSSGLACHWQPATAALAAIYDAIECDALALLWRTRMAMPQVRVETLSDANYDLVARFERAGGAIKLLKLELDLAVPTFVAVLAHEAPAAPARILAAGTDLDPEQGVRKALEMLAHTLHYCQLLHAQLPPLDPGQTQGGVRDQAAHLHYWCAHAHASRLEFLLGSDERLEFDRIESRASGDPVRDLERLLRSIDAAGYRALLAELTTPEVADLGLRVLRAVIPGLEPLYYGDRHRALAATRVLELLARRDLPAILPPTPADPHPFPRRGVWS